MFNPLLSDLRSFVTDRLWHILHSPKNMATTLSVESIELLEHFLTSNLNQTKELEEELGDVLHCILLTMDALKISPPEKIEAASYTVVDFSKEIRTFMSHFMWLEKDQEYRGEFEDLKNSLLNLLLIHFSICNTLLIDPFKAAYNKLEINKKKYPVDLVKGCVSKYFQRKKALQKSFL